MAAMRSLMVTSRDAVALACEYGYGSAFDQATRLPDAMSDNVGITIINHRFGNVRTTMA